MNQQQLVNWGVLVMNKNFEMVVEAVADGVGHAYQKIPNKKEVRKNDPEFLSHLVMEALRKADYGNDPRFWRLHSSILSELGKRKRNKERDLPLSARVVVSTDEKSVATPPTPISVPKQEALQQAMVKVEPPTGTYQPLLPGFLPSNLTLHAPNRHNIRAKSAHAHMAG